MPKSSLGRRSVRTAVVLLTLFAGIVVFNSRTRPQQLRSPDRRQLAACGASPNCVSSFATDASHAIAPLDIPAGMKSPIAALAALVQTMNGATIESQTGDYLHVVFRSALFRFPDDAEFLLDADAGRIHVRSASRVGWGDLGVNRRRLERLRQKWTVSVSAPAN